MNDTENIKTISIENYTVNELEEILPEGLLKGIKSLKKDVTDKDVNDAQQNFFNSISPSPLTDEEIEKLFESIGPYHFLHLHKSTEELRGYIDSERTKRKKNE